MPGTGRFWHVQFLRWRLQNAVPQFGVGFQHQNIIRWFRVEILGQNLVLDSNTKKDLVPSFKGCTCLVYDFPKTIKSYTRRNSEKTAFSRNRSPHRQGRFFRRKKTTLAGIKKKALSTKIATHKKGTYVPRKGPFLRGVVVVDVTFGPFWPKRENCVNM